LKFERVPNQVDGENENHSGREDLPQVIGHLRTIPLLKAYVNRTDRGWDQYQAECCFNYHAEPQRQDTHPLIFLLQLVVIDPEHVLPVRYEPNVTAFLFRPLHRVSMRSKLLIRGSEVSNDLLKCLGRLELDPVSEDRLRVIVQRMCRGTTFGETDEDLRGLGHLPERHPLELPSGFFAPQRLHTAERIKAPTLFMGGDKDFNVTLVGGEQMYQALMSVGVPAEVIVCPGQFHGFTRPSFIRDRYERWFAWYDKYLGIKPAATK
jgi:Prolyl oligopeptidase family